MNKLIKISALGIVLGGYSCKSAIDIPYTDAKQALTILFDGEINDGEMDQIIRISQTDIGKFTPVGNAQISLLVDNQPVPVVYVKPQTKSPSEPWRSAKTEHDYYTFRYAFQPGQHIKIGVSKDDKSATSECVVPSQPTLLDVKTETYERQESDIHREKRTRWAIKLRDKAGERNFYRVGIRYQAVFEDVATGQQIALGGAPFVYLEGKSDYILSDGNPLTEGDTGFVLDEVLGTEFKNIYNVFSDRLFEGKEVTISPTSDLLGIHFYEREMFTGEPFQREIDGQNKTIRYLHHTVVVYLYGITEDAYKYYLSLGKMKTTNRESPMTIPVQLYSNVVGGTGIFGVHSVARYRTNLKLKYSPDLYH